MRCEICSSKVKKRNVSCHEKSERLQVNVGIGWEIYMYTQMWCTSFANSFAGWMLPASKQRELQLTYPSTSEHNPFIIYKLFTQIQPDTHFECLKPKKRDEKRTKKTHNNFECSLNVRFIKCLCVSVLFSFMDSPNNRRTFDIISAHVNHVKCS